MEEKQLETPNIVKTARIIATIVFATVMVCLAIAIITDFTVFIDQIMAFIGGAIGAVLTFILGFLAMILSIVLIFGVYILNEQGFWPAKWASDVFHQALKDANVTQDQVNAIIAVRTMLLVLCIICFISSIIALSMHKHIKKKYPDIKQNRTKPFGVVTLFLSMFGIFAAVIMIILASSFN